MSQGNCENAMPIYQTLREPYPTTTKSTSLRHMVTMYGVVYIEANHQCLGLHSGDSLLVSCKMLPLVYHLPRSKSSEPLPASF
jgi:hypothetical protein